MGGMWGKEEEVRGLWEEEDTLAWSWRTLRGSLEQARARTDGVEGQGRWRPQLGHIGLSFQNAFFFFLKVLNKLFSYLKLSG